MEFTIHDKAIENALLALGKAEYERWKIQFEYDRVMQAADMARRYVKRLEMCPESDAQIEAAALVMKNGR